MTMTGVRVVLAEDDVLLREGLASLLERSGFQVVGQAGDAAQLLALVAAQAPELVVVDIRMPPTHTAEGLEAARQIRQAHPEVGILVLSAHVEVEPAMELLASGRGVGYLLKSRVTDVEEFLDTLERIARGGSVVDPALVAELVDARRRDDPLAALSVREREVLGLMAEGRSNAGIAHRLWVTEGTVEKHVRSILTKLTLAEATDDHPPRPGRPHLPRGALTGHHALQLPDTADWRWASGCRHRGQPESRLPASRKRRHRLGPP
jgi:DNA-binding NarL/FixJ family response regulator